MYKYKLRHELSCYFHPNVNCHGITNVLIKLAMKCSVTNHLDLHGVPPISNTVIVSLWAESGSAMPLALFDDHTLHEFRGAEAQVNTHVSIGHHQGP